MRADIVIVGGGIIGSSIACHLVTAGNAGDVVVIERDPSYEHAATPRSNGGIRRLFSNRQNIEMASYGLTFYCDFAKSMAVAGEEAPIDFRRQGYLFISDRGGHDQMPRNFDTQLSMGVEAERLNAAEVKDRFPSLEVGDIELAVLSSQDAWIDPHAALLGFRRKARALGVTYLEAEVESLVREGSKIVAASCVGGQRVHGDIFVNACGAWCAPLAASVGIEIPVEPMSRESYYFRCEATLEELPFLKTESDLAIRPEGAGYVGGVPNWAEAPGWNFDVSAEYFDEVVWPMLAQRVPAMEKLRLEGSWRGHYARSALDYSPFLGPVGDELPNLILANGFSGHGIMHAPATGRGMSEIILHGEYRSIDLSCFSYQRFRENRPFKEQGIV